MGWGMGNEGLGWDIGLRDGGLGGWVGIGMGGVGGWVDGVCLEVVCCGVVGYIGVNWVDVDRRGDLHRRGGCHVFIREQNSPLDMFP